MKVNRLSFIALVGLLLFSSCASDETSGDQGKKDTDTKGLTAFVVGEDTPTSRTTAEYDGAWLKFFWTEGDRLWVHNTAATPALRQDARNNINTLLEDNPAVMYSVKRAAKAKFWFDGTYTASSYPVRYMGNDNAVGDKITIKAQQDQILPNDASHIARDGDFGVASAQRGGDGGYHFTLEHKASYLTFLPYSSQPSVAGVYLTKIKVTADQDLAGTYTIDDAGNLSAPTGTSKSIELKLGHGPFGQGNFKIPSSLTATNSAIMVVAPGTYTNFKVEYTLADFRESSFNMHEHLGTITKTYPSVTLTSGSTTRIAQNFEVKEYPTPQYYMWDAMAEFWAGHRDANGNPDGSEPQKATDPMRYYNDIMGYTDPTGVAPYVSASHSAASYPNVNQMRWYVEQGDAHYDNTTFYAMKGFIWVGGMWIKKLGVIAAAAGKNYSDLQEAAPDGKDYRRTTDDASYTNSSVIQGRPTDTSDYFFLPIIGYAGYGAEHFRESAWYWSSTPTPNGGGKAYALSFGGSNEIKVMRNSRRYGVSPFNVMWEEQYKPY